MNKKFTIVVLIIACALLLWNLCDKQSEQLEIVADQEQAQSASPSSQAASPTSPPVVSAKLPAAKVVISDNATLDEYLAAIPDAVSGLDAQQQADFQTALEQLGQFQSLAVNKAMTKLLAMGEDSLADVIAALQQISADKQTLLTAAKEYQQHLDATGDKPDQSRLDGYQQQWQRLATKEIQLVSILGYIGGEQAAKALITTSKNNSGTELVQQNIFVELNKTGAAKVAVRYARSILDREQQPGYRLIRGAFSILLANPQQEDKRYVQRYIADDISPKIKDMAIRLGVELEMGDSLVSLIKQSLSTPAQNYTDYSLMVSLANLLPPAEFKAALDLPGLRKWDVKSAERINQFIWAQADRKEILIKDLLASYYPEERYEALKYLLGQRDGNALIRHRVAAVFNDKLVIGTEYRSLITALGYQLELNNGQLDVKALAL